MTHSTSDATKVTPFNQPYGASKAMVEAFSTTAAENLKPFGARCNIFGSGGRTNRRGAHDPTAMAHDCMVPLICYLASDSSVAVTGQAFSAATFAPPA